MPLRSHTSPNLFTYGQDSALLEESNSGVITDYLYADGRPLATFSPATGTFNYVHDDRLGTPQLATDALQLPSWGTTYQPYGTTPAIISAIVQNLRFPGQYSDLETGFNYNLNRDYMPNIGRYLETDPIGLGGGTNTFAYAADNPLKLTDVAGLVPPVTPAGIFNPNGTLTPDALQRSRMIISPEKIVNPKVPEGFGKFTTGQYTTPSGTYETHFYQNPSTGEACYHLDYKTQASGKGANPLLPEESAPGQSYPPYIDEPGGAGGPRRGVKLGEPRDENQH